MGVGIDAGIYPNDVSGGDIGGSGGGGIVTDNSAIDLVPFLVPVGCGMDGMDD